MPTDHAKQYGTGQVVALFAISLALIGGLWWYKATPEPTAVAVATSCSQFEADAKQAFDTNGSVTVSGKFATGDRVRLTLDFKGVGYSWESTGALAKPKDQTNGSGVFTSYTMSASESVVTRGYASAFATMDLAIDVAAAGEGTISVNRIPGMPLALPARIVSASCEPAKEERDRSVQAKLQ